MERIKPRDEEREYFRSPEGVFTYKEDQILHSPIRESFGWSIYDPVCAPPEDFVRTLLGDLHEQIK